MERLVCNRATTDFLHPHRLCSPQQVVAAFARADLFVFPTFAEGSSRSGMEAAAAGLPIITTENCGLPLEHGKSAIYVAVNDADALAEAISRAFIGPGFARANRQKRNESCDGKLYLDALRTPGSGVPEGSGGTPRLTRKRRLTNNPIPLGRVPQVRLSVPGTKTSFFECFYQIARQTLRRKPRRASPGFPVEVGDVGILHAAFLNESRTRARW